MKFNAKIKAIWKDSLKKGDGSFSSENNLMNGMDYHFTNRPNKQVTLPEEFIGAAYSSCFNMTLAMLLSKKNHTITSLETDCIISYDEINVTGAELMVTGTVEGISESKFNEMAEEAKVLCPIGKAFIFPTILTITLK